MTANWLSEPIHCDGAVVCKPIDFGGPLLPLRDRIAFRAKLLFNSYQAYACDGRQMGVDEFEQMEQFDSAFINNDLTENEFRQTVIEFGDFIPDFISTKPPVSVPERALIWTRDEFRGA